MRSLTKQLREREKCAAAACAFLFCFPSLTLGSGRSEASERDTRLKALAEVRRARPPAALLAGRQPDAPPPPPSSQGIEVLEIEKDSLTRKNEFLASSLHTIRRRDQARAAVHRLLSNAKK